MRSHARFPDVPDDRGHYESFYLKAADPAGGRSIWIRHTVHKRPGRELEGAVWMTWFDAGRGSPVAAKEQVATDGVTVPRDAYIRVGGAEIAPGGMQGEVAGGGVEASWSLRFADHAEAFHHFPSERMYEGPLPRTKLLSPHPSLTVDGILEVDGERIELDRWPGMIGHNWGTEHAESWIWIHAATEDRGNGPGYVDIGAGRVRLGPWLTPWIVNGQILEGGERLRLGGLQRIRRTKLAAQPTRCTFAVPGDGFVVRGVVGAPAERFVGWVYADPVGDDHHALHCSIADIDLTIERRRRPPVPINVTGAATYELGTRDTGHGIPIQPFPDG